MRNKKFSLCLLVGIFLMSTVAFAQSGDKLPPINVKEYKLKNGLTVLMHQDHSTPCKRVPRRHRLRRERVGDEECRNRMLPQASTR